MILPVWTVGIFILALGLVETKFSNRELRIIEYENEICEPLKSHLNLGSCGECICRDHGYGSVCEDVECSHFRRRPVGARECTPYSEFSTMCHFCKCSGAGIPIGCVEKRRMCMDEILEDLDDDKVAEPDLVDSLDRYLIF